MIYPKHITAWIIGLISTDGHISPPRNYKTRKRTADVCLVTTAENNWALNIQEILVHYGIITSVIQHSLHSEFANRPLWKVFLLKRNPKGKHYGVNQHSSLFDSIKYWKLEKLMMERKLSILATI